MTPEQKQRIDALTKANAIRSGRAAFKVEQRDRDRLDAAEEVAAVLRGTSDRTELLLGMTLNALLRTVGGVGPAKVRAFLRTAGVARGGMTRGTALTIRQREELADVLIDYIENRRTR